MEHRRVYAKGFYDGLQAAGGMGMTPAKYRLTLDSQTAIARKIFENVPIAEPWTVQKIMSEMTRMGSTRVDLRTAEGCLNSLKDAGLVKESQRGLFQRVVPREQLTMAAQPLVSSAPVVEPSRVVSLPSAALPNLAGALEIARSAHDEARATAVLGELARQLREQGERLLELAEELEESAIAMEERIDLAEKRATKFRELSALLKGLNEE